MGNVGFREHLRANRYTVAALARLVGVRYATAHAWTTGRTVPSPAAIARIEAAVGYPAAAWVAKAGPPPTPTGWLSATTIGSMLSMGAAEVRENMTTLGAVPFRRAYSPTDVARLQAQRPVGHEYAGKMGLAERRARRARAAPRFAEHLLALGMTMPEAAARVGVSTQSVRVWAWGRAAPRAEHAQAVERELGFAASEW